MPLCAPQSQAKSPVANSCCAKSSPWLRQRCACARARAAQPNLPGRVQALESRRRNTVAVHSNRISGQHMAPMSLVATLFVDYIDRKPPCRRTGNGVASQRRRIFDNIPIHHVWPPCNSARLCSTPTLVASSAIQPHSTDPPSTLPPSRLHGTMCRTSLYFLTALVCSGKITSAFRRANNSDHVNQKERR